MDSEKAKEVKSDLVKLFGSLGERVEATEPVVQSGVEHTSSEVYEPRSPGGQIYTVIFKTFKGDTSIVVDPPVGDLILAQSPLQADFLVTKVKAHLEVERKIKPIAPPSFKKEKVVA